MNLRNITLGLGLRFIGITTLILLLMWYVQFQARNFIQGPAITLLGSYDSVQHERNTTLTGTARNIVKLTLNGKEIHTNESGEFTHTLILENGYTIIKLAAQDRFGRTTTIEREYVYAPEPGEENGV